MATKEDIDVIGGDYVVHTNRYLSDDKEKITADISLSDDLKKLLEGFACKGKDILTERLYNFDFKRYPIKKSLKNSISWSPAMSLLFSLELMNKKQIKIKFDDINTSTDLIHKLKRDAKILVEKVFGLSCLEKGHADVLKLKPNY